MMVGGKVSKSDFLHQPFHKTLQDKEEFNSSGLRVEEDAFHRARRNLVGMIVGIRNLVG